MGSDALVQTRIDPDIRDRATAVLQNMGLTVSDAVRILLRRLREPFAVSSIFPKAVDLVE